MKSNCAFLWNYESVLKRQTRSPLNLEETYSKEMSVIAKQQSEQENKTSLITCSSENKGFNNSKLYDIFSYISYFTSIAKYAPESV